MWYFPRRRRERWEPSKRQLFELLNFIGRTCNKVQNIDHHPFCGVDHILLIICNTLATDNVDPIINLRINQLFMTLLICKYITGYDGVFKRVVCAVTWWYDTEPTYEELCMFVASR